MVRSAWFVVIRYVLREHPPFSYCRGHQIVCVCFLGFEFGIEAKYFERNLRLPFTPPLVAFFSPSIGIRAD
jgi:hypothetical protein